MILIALISLVALAISGIIIYDLISAQAYKRLAQRAVLKPIKVFQIGFSKCGTVSLAHFFNDNGIPAIHHDFGNLATSMAANARAGLPLIAPQYEPYTVYTDMENWFDDPSVNIALHYFKELDHQYPGSKFILNTRDKAAWLRSRSQHPVFGKKQVEKLLDYTTNMQGLTKEAVLEQWSQEWDQHHQAVLEYFKDRPQDLVVFNIDTDDTQKITEFFKEHFVFKTKHFQHKNKTTQQFKTTVDDPLHSELLFAKTYNINTHKPSKMVKPGLLTRYKSRHIAKISPKLDSLLQQAIQQNFNITTNDIPTSPSLYNFKFWASDPSQATRELKQTAYLQANFNDLGLGLKPGYGGMVTCLMAHKHRVVDAECYYQVKEM